MTKVVGVRFERAGKIYYFSIEGIEAAFGDNVIVESSRGLDFGRVAAPPQEIDEATLAQPLKPVIRLATAEDEKTCEENKEKEPAAFEFCQQQIAEAKLPMKLIKASYTFDGSKIVFYFSSENRVDFRELVKVLAAHFHTRIELRQVGVRDEARLLGGYSTCGRELCCAAFLDGFHPVSIKMAKKQNLALNPAKISGACGRLMCCLYYEYDENAPERPETDAAADDETPALPGCDKNCSACEAKTCGVRERLAALQAADEPDLEAAELVAYDDAAAAEDAAQPEQPKSEPAPKNNGGQRRGGKRYGNRRGGRPRKPNAAKQAGRRESEQNGAAQ